MDFGNVRDGGLRGGSPAASQTVGCEAPFPEAGQSVVKRESESESGTPQRQQENENKMLVYEDKLSGKPTLPALPARPRGDTTTHHGTVPWVDVPPPSPPVSDGLSRTQGPAGAAPGLGGTFPRERRSCPPRRGRLRGDALQHVPLFPSPPSRALSNPFFFPERRR